MREYYIAAEQVEWDYAPSGLELMHGEDVPYPWGLYRRWKKTRYVEYTDGTFSQRKPQPEWLGILGPIIRAEVGDSVVVHFRNLATGYHSIHVHGLRYDKQNEGAVYSNNLPGIAYRRAVTSLTTGSLMPAAVHLPEKARGSGFITAMSMNRWKPIVAWSVPSS